jgi:hypothetical protein
VDQRVSPFRKPVTFNGPLEAGVRAVAVLSAAHPRAFDLQRLVAFDYLLVHTGDIGGPDSLHPPTPMHSAELLVRRKLVEQALLLMMTRDLARRESSPEGIRYRAGESAVPFLAALQCQYLAALKERANWLVGELGALTDSEFRSLMRRFFDQWVEEFQNIERSLGVDS